MARRGLPSFVGRKTYLYEKVPWQGATLKTLNTATPPFNFKGFRVLYPTAYRWPGATLNTLKTVRTHTRFQSFQSSHCYPRQGWQL